MRGAPAFLPAFAASFALVFAFLSALGWAAAAVVLPSPGAVYNNAYMSLRTPAGWVCRRDGLETSCHPDAPAPRRAIIIVGAKVVGPMDDHDQYRAHLRTPRTVDTGDGPLRDSIVRFVETRQIGGRDWVVGAHFESELPGYETWYVATAGARTALLVTYSAHQTVFEDHRRDIEEMIANIVLFE